MTRQTDDLFKTASMIAEKRIRRARAEQATVARDILRAVFREIFGKDRMHANPASVPGPRKV